MRKIKSQSIGQYTIASIVVLKSDRGNFLLLDRENHPNKGKMSPVGGKISADLPESIHESAVREVYEETGISVTTKDLSIYGMFTDVNMDSGDNWMVFVLRCHRLIDEDELAVRTTPEGELAWVSDSNLEKANLPALHRDHVWPRVLACSCDDFFVVHRLREAGDQINTLIQGKSYSGSFSIDEI